jgi:hypothetical protein
LTLPVPVILKRFLAPDLVFILGIWFSMSARSAGQARAAGMLKIERKIAATAALNRPGDEWAALWQRR